MREPLFVPGATCWRVANASRVAVLIDTEAYYAALLAVLGRARRSVWILGWAFDPRTRLAPDGLEGPRDPDEIGEVLLRLARERPEVDVRLLIWKSDLTTPRRRARRRFARTTVTYREAADLPFGACHHQKVVVVDGEVAFCGGGDLTGNRWDTSAHASAEPRRRLPDGAAHRPRHEVMMLVEGEAAAALGDMFRSRWQAACGESLRSAAALVGGDVWPPHLAPDMYDSEVAIARTLPAMRGRQPACEIIELALACIARARRVIYLENQYLTSRRISRALAERLGESDGPEVVIVLTRRAPSWFDRLTMDPARGPLIRDLKAADIHGRLRILAPMTSRGESIVVHSKVSIFDDEVIRIGSANLNNRAEGFDTECELALRAHDAADRRQIARLRDRLVAHFLGVDSARLSDVEAAHGGLVAAIDVLNEDGRLLPISPATVSAWDRFVANHQLGDPASAAESWRFDKRPRPTLVPARRNRAWRHRKPRREPLTDIKAAPAD